MLDDPLCTGAMIAAALKLRKVEISPSTVLNWKRGVGRGGR